MPQQHRMTVRGLKPNFENCSNRQLSNWFSLIRTRCSRELGGTIQPPTKRQFMETMDSIRPYFYFYAQGDDFDVAMHQVSRNNFPLSLRQTSDLVRTWVYMILAFNVYAELRRRFCIYGSHKVDFIGSTRLGSFWEPRFNDRCVLYLENSIIEEMIHLIQQDPYLTNTNHKSRFWQIIFEMYDSQNYIHCLNNPRYARLTQQQNQSVNIVDNPDSLIAREYFNRTEEIEEDNIPTSAHLSEIIRNIQFPDNVRKTLYDLCMSFHMEVME